MSAIVATNASLSYDGAAIRDDGEMLCLTDMWKAHGADPAKRPANWLQRDSSQEFIAFVAESKEVQIPHLLSTSASHSNFRSSARLLSARSEEPPMPETITISIPTSAIDAAMRERIASLVASVYALTTERDEEKARRLEAERELELARVEAEAKPSEAAWEAACRLRKERDEARADLAVAENTLATALRSRDEWFDSHEAMRKERDAARIDADQYRKWLDAARERVAELESAIRTVTAIRDLAKVLP